MTTISRIVYESVLFLWTVGVFIALAPGVKERLLETTIMKSMFKCQRILDERTCREVLTYEIVHRLFMVIAAYHFILACTLLPKFPTIRDHLHNQCWFFKLLVLVAIGIGALYIPQHSYFIVYFSYIALIGSCLFLVFQFFLLVDLAEGSVAWVIAQQEQELKCKTSFKVMLYLLMFKSFDLFAASFGIVAFVLLTTSTQNCMWNDIFMVLILGACFISFGILLHPRIRLNLRPAVMLLPCAVVIFHSVFVMVVALATQENTGCNLEGTFLSAKNLLFRVNFRAILALLVMHIALFYECLRNSENSFTLGLLRTKNFEKREIKHESETGEQPPYSYPPFHFLMSTGSLYTLETVTNWYGPVINRFSSYGKSSLVGLQAHWKPAQIVTMVSSGMPVLLYISFMIYAIVTRDSQSIQSQVSAGSSNYFQIEPEGSKLRTRNTFSPYTDRKNYIKTKQNGTIGESKHDTSSQPQSNISVVRCTRVRHSSLTFYHFPREISQSYYGGRNGSNACTVIAVLIARTFCFGDVKLRQTELLSESWINLYGSCIAEGNRLYDTFINTKQQGALYLSVEDVAEELGNTLQIKNLGCSLPVSFVSNTETATIRYQLERLWKLNERLAVIFIKDSRSGVFLFDKGGPLLFADSHSYGSGGAMLVCSSDVNELVMYLAEILYVVSLEGLGTLTPIYF